MKAIKKFFQKEMVKNLLITVGLSGVFYLIVFKNGAGYSKIDDIVLREIASGQYSGEPSMNLIFSMFPFSAITYGLYNVVGTIDWYGIVQIVLIMLFLSYTVYILIKRYKETYKKVFCASLVFTLVAILFNNLLAGITFTTTAGFIAACSLVLYILPNTKIKSVLMILGIVLAFGIRPQACLMVLALFVPVWFYKNFGNKRKMLKDAVIGLITGALILVCMGVEKTFITTSEWDSFSEYNTARSEYFDYYYDSLMQMPESERLKLFESAGFTDEKEIDCLYWKGAFGFYEDFPEKIKKLVDECKKQGIPRTTLKGYLLIMRDAFLSFIHIFYVATMVAMAYLFIVNKNKKNFLLKILPLILTEIAIVSCLILGGRMPYRVYTPLYFAYIVANLYIIIDIVKHIGYGQITVNKTIKGLLLITSGLILIASANNMQLKDSDKIAYEYNDNIIRYFKSNEDNIYLFHRDGLDKIHLSDKSESNNYVGIRGWAAFSPIFEERLQKYNVKSLRELIFKDNVYFVTKAPDINKRINEIMDEEDSSIKVEKVEEVDEYTVYKFVYAEVIE